MFGIHDYPAFCTAVLVFLALPGPGTFTLLTATGQAGFRAGAAATLGLILGDQVLLWAAVAGVAALLAAHPLAFQAVQGLGAVYLAWIGLRLIWPKPGASASPIRLQPGHYTRQALLITVLNPKAIVFYMAFFPLFIHPASHRGLETYAAMALTIAGLTAFYCLSLSALAERVAQRARAHPRVGRWLERLAGVSLLGFGIRLGIGQH